MEETLEFREWMRLVDLLCIERFAVSIHDLPDQAFAQAFERGDSPEEFMADEDSNLAALLT